MRGGLTYSYGAITRGDSSTRNIALVFTGHEFAEGAEMIAETLDEEHVKASFFFTGDFYRNPNFKKIIGKLHKENHYLGAHSDKHLLYCDWSKRDSLLVTKNKFRFDLADNYTAMARHGIDIRKSTFFLPPFEWYNDSISRWTKELKLQLINFTPGTRSHADYTADTAANFRNNQDIYESIINAEKFRASGLNGYILLMHVGAGPGRKEGFQLRLADLIKYLKSKGYRFQRIDQLLVRE